MATKDELDAAVKSIADAITAEAEAVTQVDTDVEALIAAIKASPQAADFQSEVDALAASQKTLADANAALGTAHTDASAVLAPPPAPGG